MARTCNRWICFCWHPFNVSFVNKILVKTESQFTHYGSNSVVNYVKNINKNTFSVYFYCHLRTWYHFKKRVLLFLFRFVLIRCCWCIIWQMDVSLWPHRTSQSRTSWLLLARYFQISTRIPALLRGFRGLLQPLQENVGCHFKLEHNRLVQINYSVIILPFHGIYFALLTASWNKEYRKQSNNNNKHL